MVSWRGTEVAGIGLMVLASVASSSRRLDASFWDGLRTFVDSNNTILTVVAAVLTAVATSILAYLTWQSVRSADRAAEAMTIDRELRRQPLLRWTFAGEARADVLNFGSGPALNIVVCARRSSGWARSRPFDLAPFISAPGIEPSAQTSLDDQSHGTPPPLQPPNWQSVAFCSDVFGNVFLFRPPGVHPEIARPHSSVPAWAGWYARLTAASSSSPRVSGGSR